MRNLIQWKSLFGNRKVPVVIGMIHVQALPGTPKNRTTLNETVKRACDDLEIYRRANVDAILVENMHDIPYNNGNDVGPEIVAAMTRVCTEIRHRAGTMPCGLQILAAANMAAVAVAHASAFDFIRAEGFVFGHVADEGYIGACAGPLLRYRKSIGADRVQIFTDIKKKHSSHAITADLNISEVAKGAEFFLSDGVIVTGSSTGVPADVTDLLNIRDSVSLPVLVGSGVSSDNLGEYVNHCDGLIVGSSFKQNGRWDGDLDFKRVCDFMETVKQLRKTNK